MYTKEIIVDFNLFDPPKDVKVLAPKIEEFEELTDTEILSKLKSDGFFELVNQEKSLLIINDAHRATPSKRIADLLIENTNNISAIAIATGTHQPPSQQELDTLLSKKMKELPIIIHDAHLSLDKYIHLGVTSRGTPLYVNSLVQNYKQLICLNSVEPHYFAGVTGGIKSVIPGLAALPTVEKNHSWALDENSGPLITHGNPLFEDLWEMADFLENRILGVQLINHGPKIFDVLVGELRDAHNAAIEKVKQLYAHYVPNPVDLLIAQVYPPLDRSIYQAQKGLENTRQVLAPNAEIILIAECPEGIGSSYFYDTLKQFKSQDKIIQHLMQDTYKFGDHKAQKFATLTKSHTLFVISSVDEENLKPLFASVMQKEELNNYISEALRSKDSEILWCQDAGMVVLLPDRNRLNPNEYRSN